jgi:hypothetical protein
MNTAFILLVPGYRLAGVLGQQIMSFSIIGRLGYSMRDFSLDFLNIFAYSVVAFACMLSFGCSKSYATREVFTSTLEIARKSEHVIVANCISSESSWDEKKRFIFTYTTFSVEEVVNGGELAYEITLRIVGGQVGDTKVEVTDRPDFTREEVVLLFLGPKNAQGYYTLSSLQGGVLRTSIDKESGKRLVTTPITGMEILKKGSESPAPTENGVLLDDLIYSIKKSLN